VSIFQQHYFFLELLFYKGYYFEGNRIVRKSFNCFILIKELGRITNPTNPGFNELGILARDLSDNIVQTGIT
jgi:hypothetical protein